MLLVHADFTTQKKRNRATEQKAKRFLLSTLLFCKRTRSLHSRFTSTSRIPHIHTIHHHPATKILSFFKHFFFKLEENKHHPTHHPTSSHPSFFHTKMSFKEVTDYVSSLKVNKLQNPQQFPKSIRRIRNTVEEMLTDGDLIHKWLKARAKKNAEETKTLYVVMEFAWSNSTIKMATFAKSVAEAVLKFDKATQNSNGQKEIEEESVVDILLDNAKTGNPITTSKAIEEAYDNYITMMHVQSVPLVQ